MYRRKNQSNLDIEEFHSDDPMSAPDYHSKVDEILADLADYIQTQGPLTDEEVRSYIKNYLYDEKQRYGELDTDMEFDESTDDLVNRTIEEWGKRKDEFLIKKPAEE